MMYGITVKLCGNTHEKRNPLGNKAGERKMSRKKCEHEESQFSLIRYNPIFQIHRANPFNFPDEKVCALALACNMVFIGSYMSF